MEVSENKLHRYQNKKKNYSQELALNIMSKMT